MVRSLSGDVVCRLEVRVMGAAVIEDLPASLLRGRPARGLLPAPAAASTSSRWPTLTPWAPGGNVDGTFEGDRGPCEPAQPGLDLIAGPLTSLGPIRESLPHGQRRDQSRRGICISGRLPASDTSVASLGRAADRTDYEALTRLAGEIRDRTSKGREQVQCDAVRWSDCSR
jgi:hypothetical protein